MTEAPVSSKDQSRHDPWAKDCPSTHCNRRDECCSPNECCSPTRPKGEAKAALLGRLREPDVREAVARAIAEYEGPFVRKNKERRGDQWEVVMGVPANEPIDDDNLKVIGVYATNAEATAVACQRGKAECADAALAKIAEMLT